MPARGRGQGLPAPPMFRRDERPICSSPFPGREIFASSGSASPVPANASYCNMSCVCCGLLSSSTRPPSTMSRQRADNIAIQQKLKQAVQTMNAFTQDLRYVKIILESYPNRDLSVVVCKETKVRKQVSKKFTVCC